MSSSSSASKANFSSSSASPASTSSVSSVSSSASLSALSSPAVAFNSQPSWSSRIRSIMHSATPPVSSSSAAANSNSNSNSMSSNVSVVGLSSKSGSMGSLPLPAHLEKSHSASVGSTTASSPNPPLPSLSNSSSSSSASSSPFFNVFSHSTSSPSISSSFLASTSSSSSSSGSGSGGGMVSFSSSSSAFSSSVSSSSSSTLLPPSLLSHIQRRPTIGKLTVTVLKAAGKTFESGTKARIKLAISGKVQQTTARKHPIVNKKKPVVWNEEFKFDLHNPTDFLSVICVQGDLDDNGRDRDRDKKDTKYEVAGSTAIALSHLPQNTVVTKWYELKPINQKAQALTLGERMNDANAASYASPTAGSLSAAASTSSSPIPSPYQLQAQSSTVSLAVNNLARSNENSMSSASSNNANSAAASASGANTTPASAPPTESPLPSGSATVLQLRLHYTLSYSLHSRDSTQSSLTIVPNQQAREQVLSLYEANADSKKAVYHIADYFLVLGVELPSPFSPAYVNSAVSPPFLDVSASPPQPTILERFPANERHDVPVPDNLSVFTFPFPIVYSPSKRKPFCFSFRLSNGAQPTCVVSLLYDEAVIVYSSIEDEDEECCYIPNRSEDSANKETSNTNANSNANTNASKNFKRKPSLSRSMSMSASTSDKKIDAQRVSISSNDNAGGSAKSSRRKLEKDKRRVPLVMYLPKCLCFLSRIAYVPQLRAILTDFFEIFVEPALKETEAAVVSYVQKFVGTDKNLSANGVIPASVLPSASISAAVPGINPSPLQLRLDVFGRTLEQYVSQLLEEVPLPLPCRLPVEFRVSHSHYRLALPAAELDFPHVEFSLFQLFHILDTDTILFILRCILCESKIVFHSSQLSLLHMVSESLIALCFPFAWSHIYVPFIPLSLAQIVDAPIAFIIGIHTENVAHALELCSDPHHLVVVDIDRSIVECSFAPPAFPAQSLRILSRNLRKLIRPSVFSADKLHAQIAISHGTQLRTTSGGAAPSTVVTDGTPATNSKRAQPPLAAPSPFAPIPMPSASERLNSSNSFSANSTGSRSSGNPNSYWLNVHPSADSPSLPPSQPESDSGNSQYEDGAEIEASEESDLLLHAAFLRSHEDSLASRAEEESRERRIRVEFLQFLASLISNYRDFLFFSNGTQPIFDTPAFLALKASKADNALPFLSKFLETQLFRDFLDRHIEYPSLLQDYLSYIHEHAKAPSAMVPYEVPLPQKMKREVLEKKYKKYFDTRVEKAAKDKEKENDRQAQRTRFSSRYVSYPISASFVASSAAFPLLTPELFVAPRRITLPGSEDPNLMANLFPPGKSPSALFEMPLRPPYEDPNDGASLHSANTIHSFNSSASHSNAAPSTPSTPHTPHTPDEEKEKESSQKGLGKTRKSFDLTLPPPTRDGRSQSLLVLSAEAGKSTIAATVPAATSSGLGTPSSGKVPVPTASIITPPPNPKKSNVEEKSGFAPASVSAPVSSSASSGLVVPRPSSASNSNSSSAATSARRRASQVLASKSLLERRKDLTQTRLYQVVAALLARTPTHVEMGELSAVGELLALPEWRKIFVEIVGNAFGLAHEKAEHRMLPTHPLLSLSLLFNIAIEECESEEDFPVAKALINFAAKVYHCPLAHVTSPTSASAMQSATNSGSGSVSGFGIGQLGGSRESQEQEYLLSALRRQRLWNTLSFWAFCFNDELRRRESEYKRYALNGNDDEKKKRAAAFDILCFELLGTLLYTQLSLGVSEDMCRALVMRCVAEHDLGEERMSTLFHLIDNLRLSILESQAQHGIFNNPNPNNAMPYAPNPSPSPVPAMPAVGYLAVGLNDHSSTAASPRIDMDTTSMSGPSITTFTTK